MSEQAAKKTEWEVPEKKGEILVNVMELVIQGWPMYVRQSLAGAIQGPNKLATKAVEARGWSSGAVQLRGPPTRAEKKESDRSKKRSIRHPREKGLTVGAQKLSALTCRRVGAARRHTRPHWYRWPTTGMFLI
ncbi:hypothetical protein NDU88_004948 [Pleurodeles waltl]|uniref:Uncharacterized protein n=1 Tax=Pleurodeles waltl TaxID=8319 RepID=A0AAV7LQU1_PLEWA|nr:hypothetical protein NDU88_004948 [Pleurodeles waltl]